MAPKQRKVGGARLNYPQPVENQPYDRAAAEQLALQIYSSQRNGSTHSVSGAPFSHREARIFSRVTRTGEATRRENHSLVLNSKPIQQEVVHDIATFRRVAMSDQPHTDYTPSMYDIAAMGAFRHGLGTPAFHRYVLAMTSVYAKNKTEQPFLQRPTNLLSSLRKMDGKIPLVISLDRLVQSNGGIQTTNTLTSHFSHVGKDVPSHVARLLRLLESMGQIKGYPHYLERRTGSSQISEIGPTTIWIRSGARLPKGILFPELDILSRLTEEPTLLAKLHAPFRSKGKLWGNPEAVLSYRITRSTLDILERAGVIERQLMRRGVEGKPPMACSLTRVGLRYAEEYRRTGEYPEALRRDVIISINHNERKMGK